MKFCSKCGHQVSLIIPEGDTRERFVCTSCATIHYENPRNVVGTIPVWKDKVLLCKRAIYPRMGFWTLPAGFLEVGESTAAGAMRETLEEAGAQVEIGPLFSLLNVIHAEQVHLFYLAQLNEPTFSPGIESLEVGLFSKSEIPWEDLAFPTIRKTLEWYFSDKQAGVIHFKDSSFATHLDDIPYDGRIDKKYRSS
jgi:ADP-ribose pyrophosphatase YjhB (NUDIX family)